MAVPSEAMRRYMDGEIESSQYFIEIAEETRREVEAEHERIRQRAGGDSPAIGGASLSTEAIITKIDT